MGKNDQNNDQNKVGSEEQQKTWWQKHWRCVLVIVVVLSAIFFLLAYVFEWSWVGVRGGESKVTKTMITPGATTATPATTVATEYPPAKNLWDWLGVLAIPVVVGFGVAWFTHVQQQRDLAQKQAQDNRDKEAARLQHDRDQQLADQRAQTEQDIATDNQREVALQAYIDKMSELLLIKAHLGESLPDGNRQQQNGNIKDKLKPEDEVVRKIARVRTLTVLSRLDKKRKRSILQFLYEASLIDKDRPIVDLRAADLDQADFFLADLHRANLSGAHLRSAILILTNLEDANLSEAILSQAHLSEAHLSRANLSRAYLFSTDLSRADLRDADLSEAHLFPTSQGEAVLWGADLSRAGANLSEANLSGAKVTPEQLALASTLSNATLPDGSKFPSQSYPIPHHKEP